MQIKPLHLVSGIHKYATETARGARSRTQASRLNEIKMSKTAAITLSPSATLVGRLLAAVDRWLMAYAEIQIRNGDIPRVGL
jgi:hypothetical protein